MSKKFLAAVLATGLLSSTVATQAADLYFSHETTGFLFEDVSDLWTGTFVVDNTLDNRDVVLSTYAYRNSWTDEWSFDPFLVVWDANGNMVGFNNDFTWANHDAYLNLGHMDDGTYYFTIGNWPNQMVKNTVDFNEVGASFAYYGDNPSVLYDIHGIAGGTGQWRVYIAGVSAIPEPETWAMLLVGLTVMGSFACRRKH